MFESRSFRRDKGCFKSLLRLLCLFFILKISLWDEPSAWATVFVLLTIQGKMTAKSFQAKFLRGYTIASITAHVPGQHMWPSPGPWPESKCSAAPKQWKSDVYFKKQDATDVIWEGKKIYRACHCTDGISATQNGQGVAKTFCTLLDSNPRLIATKLWVGIDLAKKPVH